MGEDLAPGSDAPEFGSNTIGNLRQVARALDQAWGAGAEDAPTRIDQVGPFRRLDRVGKGGMGAVYRAIDSRTNDVVAVKIPTSRFLTDPALHARFYREADAAGLLDHPGIVGFRELGEDGPRLFIVSDFCDGPNLAAWIRAQPEPTTGRGAARLVAELADAVAHAHDRGVLHRDLKPSNVMLPGARPDSDVGRLKPKITDFGLAKLVDGLEGDDQPTMLLLTQTGDVIGSPAYMAPEQASGRAAEVGRETDVYGLGTILYTLLTGRPPFRGETVPETLRLVCETDPVPLREFRPGLSSDLDRIALRCLEKKPADRYPTASALADDLRRFLDGRPLDRRTGSLRRRIGRWARRKPRLARSLAAGAVGATLLVAAGVAWNVSLSRLNDRLVRVNEQLTRERELTDRLNYTLTLQLAQRANDDGQLGRSQLLLGDLAPRGGGPDYREFAWRHLWWLTRREARLVGEMKSEITHGRPAVASDGALLALSDSEGGVGLFDLIRGKRFWYRGRDAQALGRRRALSGDGRRVATASTEPNADGSVTLNVEVRAAETGEVVAVLPPRPGRTPERLMLGAQGTRLRLIDCALAPKNDVRTDFRLTNWDLRPGAGRNLVATPIAEFPLPAELYANIAVTPDGVGLARNTLDDRPGVYRLEDGALMVPLADAPPKLAFNLARFSPDGRRLAVYERNTRVLRIWDARSGKLLHRAAPSESHATRVALQPGGEAYAMAVKNEEVRLVDPPRGVDLQIIPPNPYAEGHAQDVKLAFTPKGDGLLVSRHPYMEPIRIQLRSTTDGTLLAESPVLDMGKVGDWIVLDESTGGPALVWTQGRYAWRWEWDRRDADVGSPIHSDEVWAVRYNAKGSVLVTASNDTYEDQTVKVWDARTYELKRGWKAHNATVTEVSIAPDGRRLATSSLSAEQPIRIWDLKTGALLAAPDWPDAGARSLAFDHRGERLAAAGGGGNIVVWHGSDLKTLWKTVGHVNRIHAVVFSPDSAWIATGGDDGYVRFWDAATGAKLGEFRGPSQIMALAFDPKGRRLAAGSDEGTVYLLDGATMKLERVIRSDDRDVRGLAFSPDGRTLASGGLGKSIRLWDPETGHELLSLDGHEAQINALTFAPDGSTLVSADHSGAIRAWRAALVAPE